MTTQMTVRLSDESAAYIDQLVAGGGAPSRAAAIDRFVKRERRRARAVADAAIYARDGEDPELDGMAAAAVAEMLDLDS